MARELTRKQFDVLEAMIQEKKSLSQRQLETSTGISLGSVNRTVKELTDLGYVANGAITDAGVDAMEPYRAKRAIFIAAGFGTRMVPLTFNTPKPLIRVHGKRIIDGLIDACLTAGIEEIYIVRGYLSEQFDQLLYKYPMIKFLENAAYNDANNISSAMVARYLMSNAYILEADIILSKPSLIKKYHYCSDVVGIKTNRTDDWCVVVKDGIVQDQMVGGEGENIWRVYGISYWNDADGHKLSNDILEVYQSPGGKERYWDQVPLHFCREHYRVEIRDAKEEDIVEIDTFKELKAIDSTYDI